MSICTDLPRNLIEVLVNKVDNTYFWGWASQQQLKLVADDEWKFWAIMWSDYDWARKRLLYLNSALQGLPCRDENNDETLLGF